MSGPVAHWWTKRQLELVEDRSRIWRRELFQSSPSVEQWLDDARVSRRAANRESGAVVPDGWDHEHCALCWAKIGKFETASADGYTDGDTWLCVECFDQYIAPRVQA